MKKKFLINFIYYTPVGHVVEAIKFARGFYEANKDIEIHLALNNESPTELTKAAPWIRKTYSIDTEEVLKKGYKADSLRKIPKLWDYIVIDNRVILENKGKENLVHMEKEFVNWYNLTDKLFKYKIWKGSIWCAKKFHRFLKYKPDRKVTLNLPKSALNFAERYKHKGNKISIMLGGSAHSAYYPSIKSWIKIIKALNEEFLDTKIYLTGIKRSIKGRTHTRAYTESNMKNILSRFNNVVDCYDIGLWNQLALVKQCDFFLSPHTGFAFLAPCVGTPWLAISGGYWHEYLFNRTPFYSVLPDAKGYPHYTHVRAFNLHDKYRRIPEINPKNLDKKIPDIIKGAKLLMSDDFTYKKALALHLKNIKELKTKKKAFFSFDNALGLNPPNFMCD